MADKIEAAGVKYAMFIEADMDDEATALATEPVANGLRELFADLPLLEVRAKEGAV